MRNAKLIQAFMIMLIITYVVIGNSMIVNATTLEAYGSGVDVVTEDVSELEAVDVEENLATTQASNGTWGTINWNYSDGMLTISLENPSLGPNSMPSPDGIPDSYSIDDAETVATIAAGYPWHAYRNSVTKIVMGDGVTGISDLAFYNMPNLKDVSIDYVGDFGRYAFAKCTGLEEINISNNADGFNTGVFYGCTALKKVTGKVPTSDYAFYGCTGLQEVTINQSQIGAYAFKDCTGITKVNLLETGCIVGKGAFYNCINLEEITGSITEPSDYSFYNCKKLVNTAWSERGIGYVGSYAYYGCTSLKEIYFPVVTFGPCVNAYSFYGCTSLTKVTFERAIVSLSRNAFTNCALKEVWMTDCYDIMMIGQDVFSGNNGCKIYGLSSNTDAKKIAAESGCTYVPINYIDQPILSALTNEPTGVHVYWDAVDYALTYNVYRSSSPNDTFTMIKSGIKTTDYIDVTAVPGSTYYYKVMAVGEKVSSSQSDASKGITHVAVPGFKKIVNVVSGVHVYWNAADGAKSYNVYRSIKKGEGYSLIKTGLTATHYIDTTAVSGNTYYYKVVGVNGTSTSADTEPFKAITYVGTPDITSRINKGAGIQLGWDKINGATGYAIYRKPYDTGSWVRIATIEGNKTFSWTDTSVKANNGTVYRYTIRALAGSDMKTLSGCRNTGRTMVRLASRTMNSATKASATSIKCNWTTTAACNGYEVRFMIGSSVYKTFTVGNYKTGVKTFTGLKAGQTYKIQVRTYKKVEGVGTFYSAWSPEKYVSL